MKKVLGIFFMILTVGRAYSQQGCTAFGEIEASKMAVLYIGAANPIQYTVNNTDPKTLKFSCQGCDSFKTGLNNQATIWVSRPGRVTIQMENKEISVAKHFFAKYCPNPAIQLFSGQKSGSIKASKLQQQQGIVPILENFDLEVRCKVMTFRLTRYRNGEMSSNGNEGNRFHKNNLDLIQTAQTGDLFIVTEIKGECTSDLFKRDWGSMAFQVQ